MGRSSVTPCDLCTSHHLVHTVVNTTVAPASCTTCQEAPPALIPRLTVFILHVLGCDGGGLCAATSQTYWWRACGHPALESILAWLHLLQVAALSTGSCLQPAGPGALLLAGVGVCVCALHAQQLLRWCCALCVLDCAWGVSQGRCLSMASCHCTLVCVATRARGNPIPVACVMVHAVGLLQVATPACLGPVPVGVATPQLGAKLGPVSSWEVE